MKRCSSAGGGSSFKFYSLDGPEACSTAVESLTTLKGSGCSDCGESGRNVSALCADRYHSEAEFERVLRKRRMRLLIIIEKAFTGVEAVSPDEIRVPGCNGMCAFLSKPGLLSLSTQIWSHTNTYKCT